MSYLEEIIQRVNCFIIQKASNHGAMVLYQNRMIFVYDNGKEDMEFDLEYSDISDIKIETGIVRALDILKIDAHDKSFQFNGIQDIENVKQLIALLKQHNTNPKVTYGFKSTGTTKREWKDLEDPILLCSYTLPADIKTVIERMLSKDFFIDLYTTFEGENIIIDEWRKKDGYQERTIHYQKVINIPFMGKSIIQIAETQLLYTFTNKFTIQVVSELGKTPFAECFDPQAQIFFEDKGKTVDFLVKYKMVWVSEPAFKSIIDSRTTDANRVFYQGFGKQLLRELGGSVDSKSDKNNKNESNDENEKEENAENDENENEALKLSKIKIIYKFVIIALLIILAFIFYLKYRRHESYFFSFWKLFHLIVFIVLLFNF